jgi:hypothetical protein
MKLMVLLAAAILTGCGAESSEESPATPAPDASALASRSLGSGSLPQIQLLATPDGRDLMARVVSCALPRGAKITTINRNGTPYAFVGALGLAPGWADHAPSSIERRRVDDCLRGSAAGSTAATAVVTRTPSRG